MSSSSSSTSIDCSWFGQKRGCAEIKNVASWCFCNNCKSGAIYIYICIYVYMRVVHVALASVVVLNGIRITLSPKLSLDTLMPLSIHSTSLRPNHSFECTGNASLVFKWVAYVRNRYFQNTFADLFVILSITKYTNSQTSSQLHACYFYYMFKLV